MINDITTSLEDPPQFVQLAKDHPENDYKYPTSFMDEHQMLYGDLQPLSIDGDVDKAFEQVKRVASLMSSWKIVSIDAENYRIEAVATTKWLRFKDDVVIEIRASIGGSEVHMRSKSRVGRSDLGANAKRIRQFFKKLESSL